ncbi:MAG: site-2 protease family protein [Bdellovibrionota bacterium]
MSASILEKASYLIALILSLSVHEWAHAFVSYRLGDDTAKNYGRLTLNPLAHIDPIGTLLFPILAAVTGVPLFGWAKPVPVNVLKLRSPRIGHSMVAAAGPLSNLLIAFFSILIVYVIKKYTNSSMLSDDIQYGFLMNIMGALILINCILALFNLLPIPPLDGGAVLGGLLPVKVSRLMDRFIAPYGMFILILLIMTDSLAWMYGTAVWLIGLMRQLVSALI